MKIVFVILLLLNFAFLGSTILNLAHTTAKHATIICTISDLRDVAGLEPVEKVEIYVSNRQREIEDAYRAPMWTSGISTTICALALLVACLKRVKKRDNTEP